MELEGGPTSFGRALVLDTLCTYIAAPCRCRGRRKQMPLSLFSFWSTFHANIVPGFKLALTIECFNKFKANLF